jgi:magnesium transporter
MNFNTEASPWNMPELNWYFGYPLALGVMVTVAGGMLLHFHRRGWLRRQDLGGRMDEREGDRKGKDVVE